MNNRIMIICILALTMLGSILPATAQAQDDIREHRSCSQCGMDRKAYGFSRMLIIYRDGGKSGVCSLHCAVNETGSNKGREIASLLVADRNSRELINAEKAFWVMGGKKRGVMTPLAKWAFAREQDAQEFVKNYGGELATFDNAMKSAREEVPEMAK